MNEGFQNNTKAETPVDLNEGKETFSHLDVGEVMKAYNAYFVHIIQVTKALDVSQNNQVIDTKNLSVSDKLDILYAGSPTLSTSTIRPATADGTFYGGLGLIVSKGEIVSAHPSDGGSIAMSLTERSGLGGDTPEDIEHAINRTHLSNGTKSYNEVVVRSPEIAGGFIKISEDSRVSYEDNIRDYGPGGEVVTEKIGLLDLSTVYDKDFSGNPDPKRILKSFDVPFNTLREMELRGPVFVMNEQNQIFQVTEIDVTKRIISFSTTPFTPSDVADVYGSHSMSSGRKEELLENLQSKGVVLK